MKKTKRLLSMLTALAITASSFATMVIPASAADDGATIVPVIDYEGAGAVVDWTTATSGRFDPLLRTVDGNTFLTVNQAGRHQNSVELTSATIAEDFTATRYAVEFDLKLGSSAGQDSTEFKINTDDGQLFDLLQANRDGGFKINGDATVLATFPGGGNSWNETAEDVIDRISWLHFTVCYGEGPTYVTITNPSDSSTVLEQTLLNTLTSTGKLTNMKFISSRYDANFAIDNFTVRNLKENEIPQVNYYNISFATQRYAKIVYKVGEDVEKTAFADVDGKFGLTNIPEDTEFTYTISKEGYKFEDGSDTKTETFTFTEDKTIEAPMTLTADIGVDKDNLIYYENTFGYESNKLDIVAGNRLSDTALGTIEIDSDIYEIKFDLNIPAEEKTQITMAFFGTQPGNNTDKNDIFGIQGYSEGLFAFSDLQPVSTSSDTRGWNQSCQGLWTEGVKLADSYVGEYTVDMIVNNNNKTVTVKAGDNAAQMVSFTKDASKITYIRVGKAETQTGLSIDNLMILKPDQNYVGVTGDNEFAKIAGKTVTRQYEAEALVALEGETFTWSVEGAGTAGVTIDQNGVLSVTDAATPGTYTVKAACTVDGVVSTKKVGTFDVEIKDIQVYTPTVEYTKAVQAGENGQLTLIKIVDALGDDVTEYFDPVWSIDGVADDADVALEFTNLTPGAATVIYADYNGTTLKSVMTEDVTVPADGTLSILAGAGTKVMIWDSLDGIKPLAEAQTGKTADVGDNLAIVGATSGVLVTNAEKTGNVTVTLTLTEGSDFTYEITIGNYSMIVDPRSISVADLITYGATEFKVVLDNGTVLTKTAENDIITLTEDEIGDAEEAEVMPMYKFDLGGASTDGYTKVEGTKADGYGFLSAATPTNGTGAGIQSMGVNLDSNSFEVDIPDGRYDMTFYKADTIRTHIRVNEYMTVTEADFTDGDNGTVDPMSGPGVYTKLDVNVTGGVAKINAYQWGQGNPLIAAVEITKKSDEFEPRKPHIWIAGDSTVCIYRPTPAKDDSAPGTRRTGWGQLLENYLDDSVIVDDFAHSGDWAANWYANTFPSVIQNAEAGDYLIIQFGINDRTRTPDQAVMKAALVNMVKECRAKGVIPVIQTPELCPSQYGTQVTEEHTKPNGSGHAGYFEVNRTVAKEENTLFIDLGDISATMWATMGKTWVTENYFLSKSVVDTQHMSYQGAKLVASMVATEILDQKVAGKTGAAGETFDGIPVNAKVQADVTYTDASDNTEKTITRQAAEFKLKN